jgi:hypothetical protein
MHGVRCAVYEARQLLSIIRYEHNKDRTDRLPVACIPCLSPKQPFDSELHASINLLVVMQLFKTFSNGRGFMLIKREVQELHMTSRIVARLSFNHAILR